MAALDDYQRLLARVDAHATSVEGAHWDAFACRPGCSGCCHRQLSVFPVEAARIRSWIDDAGLAEPTDCEPIVDPLTVVDDSEPCALLDAAGRCRIYPVRPVICRTHGLPLAVPDGDGLRADVCPLNFVAEGLGVLASSEFLSLTPLNTVLAAVNAAHVAEVGGSPARVELSELL